MANGMCGVGYFLWLFAIHGWATASEFPDRECCDLTSQQPTTTSSSVPPTEPLQTVRPGKC